MGQELAHPAVQCSHSGEPQINLQFLSERFRPFVQCFLLGAFIWPFQFNLFGFDGDAENR